MDDALRAAKQKAETTYNAAADHFDDEPLAFWARIGRRTVDRLALVPGARVLDVCCGTGASAIPAGEAVGPTGSVVGVDLAADLLALGRAKAAAAGLEWVDFQRADMTALPFTDGEFDAVVCVFGIFFVPDMERQVAELWRFVRPGGRLAVTTWGPGIFSPAYELWLEALREVRPDLHSAFNPWDRITTPDAVRKLFADAGIADVAVTAEASDQPLRTSDDYWTIAIGSGIRWTVDQLGPEVAAAVRSRLRREIAEQGIDRVATNSIYAIARKPAG